MIEDLIGSATAILQSPSAIVQLVLGAVLLLFGRRLFWLLIGVLGFVGGLWLAETFLRFDSPMWRLLTAAALGVLGALAAVFLQRVAIAVGGAVIAAYSAWWYLSLGRPELENWQWLLVIGAGLAGLMVARLLADLALVVLSALAGATLVLQSLDASPTASRWLFIGVVALGVAAQVSSLGSGRRGARSSER